MIKRILKKVEPIQFSPASVPLLLFIISFLTYGLFFWQRGFYWDEVPWTWTYYRLGSKSLTQLFSTSRPFWGMIYQVTMPIIGPYPWRWQALVIILRWLTALQVWLILRRVWSDARPALWASLLFLVYPGLSQNFISLMYSHFYIVLNCYLLSIYLSILAIQNPQRRIPFTVGALTFSFVNLLTMEYFYFMEFARVAFLWLVMPNNESNPSNPDNASNGKEKPGILAFLAIKKFKDLPFWRRIIALIKIYLPYIAIVFGVTFWRVFFFKYQNASYKYVTVEELRADPLAGIVNLILVIAISFWETCINTWLSPFHPLNVSKLGRLTAAVTIAIALSAVLLVGVYLYAFKNKQTDSKWTIQALALGVILWTLAGGSFWLVGILPKLAFSGDRFTMPYMFGSALMLAALIGMLSKYSRFQYALLALVIGFSVARQFQLSTDYRRDWEKQRDFFWQMSWRMPSIKPQTMLLSNDLPMTYYSDNSLSGALNWIYSPEGRMDYILYYISVRLGGTFPTLDPGYPVDQYYLSTVFYGNTSQVIVINYNPPGCLRVVDPDVDEGNRLLPKLVRDAARLSDVDRILPETRANLPAQLYTPEPARGWCYYFEKADLARQFKDWEQVAALGDKAFTLDDYPNDPVERFVFIEGYAHVGQWKKALELSKVSYKVSKDFVGPPLCKLWERITRETNNDKDKPFTVQDARAKFQCLP